VTACLVLSVRDLSSDAGAFVAGVTAQALPTGNGNVEVRYISGLDVNKSYQITFLVF
jgi:hypothetical protein